MNSHFPLQKWLIYRLILTTGQPARVILFVKVKESHLSYGHTGWNDKIVALEKTWFHFRLMKTGFLFVADHLLVGQLCTNPKNDKSLLSCLKVTQCSTSDIGDEPLYNSCSLPIQVMTTGPLPAPSKCKSRWFNAWGHNSTHRTTLWRWWSGSPMLRTSCRLTSLKSA